MDTRRVTIIERIVRYRVTLCRNLYCSLDWIGWRFRYYVVVLVEERRVRYAITLF